MGCNSSTARSIPRDSPSPAKPREEPLIPNTGIAERREDDNLSTVMSFTTVATPKSLPESHALSTTMSQRVAEADRDSLHGRSVIPSICETADGAKSPRMDFTDYIDAQTYLQDLEQMTLQFGTPVPEADGPRLSPASAQQSEPSVAPMYMGHILPVRPKSNLQM